MTRKQKFQQIVANLNNESGINQDILTITAFFDTEQEIADHIAYYAKLINKSEKYKNLIAELN